MKKIKTIWPRRILSAIAYIWKRRKKEFARAYIESVSAEGSTLIFEGYVISSEPIEGLKLRIRKFREESVNYQSFAQVGKPPIHLRFALFCASPLKKLHAEKFAARSNAPWSEMPNSIYGFGLDSESRRISTVFREQNRKIIRINAETVVYVYRDPAVGAARIERLDLTEAQVDMLRRYAPEPPHGSRVTCLVYEYTNSAKDNGLALFKKLEDDSGIRSAYVIEREGADGVVPDDKAVLAYGEIDHLLFCLEADVLAFSHHRTYGYPQYLKEIRPDRHSKTKSLFLQHGIMALKRSPVRHYDYNRCKYDGVCVSSEQEKRIFEKHFNFPAERIHVTGLARYDNIPQVLVAPPGREKIVVFPTWRQGLEKAEPGDFRRSQFFREWSEAILHIRRNTDFEVVLMLHPIMSRHAEAFEGVADKLADAAFFQDELRRASCLITDYSSVAFDAIYSGRPVYFYHFDRDEFGFDEDAFIDVDKDMPGPVAFHARDLLDFLRQGAASNWALDDRSAEKYFQFRDKGNARRVIDVIRLLGTRSET